MFEFPCIRSVKKSFSINLCSHTASGQSVVSFNHTPYPVVCPGDTLVFTCIVEGTGGGVAWRRNNDNNPAILSTGGSTPTLDDFTLSITSYVNDVLVSTATNLSVPLQLNGSTIGCSSDLMDFETSTISIAGMYQHAHDDIIYNL